MKRIGIIAALPGELRPLVHNWDRRGAVWSGRIGQHEAVAACAGMGAAAVTRACERVLADGALDALVSIGWAGSLSCGLRTATATVVREVIDAGSGERFPTAIPDGQRLITIDRVADAQEKRRLAQEYQAVLVDMEAATVARLARTKDLDFYCFKGISDGPSDKLPDFNRFIGADGQLRMAAFLTWAAVHPATWRPIGRLAKNSRAAAGELAQLVITRLADTVGHPRR